MTMTQPADADHQPMCDLAAERAVLGAMMTSTVAVADVIGVIGAAAERASDFYRPVHQAIYQQILELYGLGEPHDPIAVADALDRKGDLTRIGGAPYLHTLMSEAAPASAAYHAGIVTDRARRRRLQEAATRIAVYATGADAGEALARAQAELDNVADARETAEIDSVGNLLQAMYDAVDDFQTGARQRGIRTGILDLDALTNGLHPGQLITLAARPGMGKSVLGLNFARACSVEQDMASVIFSLEMSKTEIMFRLAAAHAKIRLSSLRSTGGLTDDDWTHLARSMATVSEAPLYIDDSPSATVADIRAKARRLKQQLKRQDRDLRLIVVDYLQLMTSGQRTENRQQEVSDFSRQLKLLAKELEVPVVAISQLNRGPEQRTDKRPMLSDLRESGSIEQDSDVVILIHRPDAYERDCPRAGEADLILAKHRDGQQATVTVAHQLHYSRFCDLATEEAS
ncbi:replicative DNA helicase [Prauserella endophytica]|uniref:Replicative DNA helicase n=1 Tax=Prauserella endophytica TaxID=1592324 RepID=A0ABY2RUU9_9PSEU|nr:replicative DNA helicase [Prauserella endophytica]TKG61494.1 replicative DNA helicase [Prauserella endophytica]